MGCDFKYLIPCALVFLSQPAPAAKHPSMAEVLAASSPADWRPLDINNTLYVELPAGRVVIDGRVLPEPWLPPAMRSATAPGPSYEPYALHRPYRIPSGDVYMMGDNRSESCDSRYWGPISESTIVGKVDLRIWPLRRFGFF